MRLFSWQRLLNDQRIDRSLPVQGSHGGVDCAVEGGRFETSGCGSSQMSQLTVTHTPTRCAHQARLGKRALMASLKAEMAALTP
jgi:hypothetical protein